MRDVLGDPDQAPGDGRAWVYEYDVAAVYLVWPLCFGGNRGPSDRFLTLRFDVSGVLRAYKVTTHLNAASEFAGVHFLTPEELYSQIKGVTP